MWAMLSISFVVKCLYDVIFQLLSLILSGFFGIKLDNSGLRGECLLFSVAYKYTPLLLNAMLVANTLEKYSCAR